MKRPRSKVSPKLCKMQNRQVFSWMEKPAFVANCIVGAGVLYHCRCLCCTNQPTKMVSGFQGSSTLSLVIHSNILDLYLKYSLFWVKSMHTFKLCGDSYQFLNINFWVRPPLYPLCWCPRSIKSWTLFGDSFHRLPPPESHNSGFPNLFPTWFVLPITPDRPRV